MKFLVLVSIALWASLASCGPLKGEEIKTWEQFKHFYGKSYSIEEESNRKQIFEQNLKFVEENQGQNGVQLGINEFSDLSDAEFFAKNEQISHLNQSQLFESVPLADLTDYYETFPAHFDWLEHIRWNPIENQGHCGSCWAFATVQAVEAVYEIRHKVHVHLSKQELVDCSLNTYNHHYMNQGCRMGYTTEALKYMKEHGVHEEQFYPYKMANNVCYLNRIANHKSYQINDYRRLATHTADTGLMSVLKNNGPIVVNINDGNAIFKHYRSGVIRNLMPNIAKTTHSVVLVGWGHENGVDYWRIRNSWGATWGDHGYVKIERHHNLMGINNVPVYPILH